MSQEMLNQYANSYYKQLSDVAYREPVAVSPQDTALILIDIQNFNLKDYFVKSYQAMGIDVDAIMPILDQLEENTVKTISNIEKILKKCREVGIPPIHIKIESSLQDGRDVGRLHKLAGMVYPKDGFDSDFCEQVKPLENEVVLNKTCSGIHVGTNIDRIMRNMGIQKVIVVGFYTDQCVSTSVRDLSDLGYEVDLIVDAVGAMSEERHLKALQSIAHLYANSETTEALLERL